jgi:hypothetical protein
MILNTDDLFDISQEYLGKGVVAIFVKPLWIVPVVEVGEHVVVYPKEIKKIIIIQNFAFCWQQKFKMFV